MTWETASRINCATLSFRALCAWFSTTRHSDPHAGITRACSGLGKEEDSVISGHHCSLEFPPRKGRNEVSAIRWRWGAEGGEDGGTGSFWKESGERQEMNRNEQGVCGKWWGFLERTGGCEGGGGVRFKLLISDSGKVGAEHSEVPASLGWSLGDYFLILFPADPV